MNSQPIGIKKRFRVVCSLVCFSVLLSATPVNAGVSAAAIRELIELVSKKFGSEMSEDAIKALPRGVEQAVKSGGADAVQRYRSSVQRRFD